MGDRGLTQVGYSLSCPRVVLPSHSNPINKWVKGKNPFPQLSCVEKEDDSKSSVGEGRDEVRTPSLKNKINNNDVSFDRVLNH